MRPEEIHNKRILFGVLDWGLGHATRSAPLIKILMNQGNELVLASDGLAAEWLIQEFPGIPMLSLPAYNISYSKSLPLALKLGAQIPKLYKLMRRESVLVSEYHQSYSFDLVISDNRPGVWLEGVHSIYMTHQLRVKAGFFSSVATALHKNAYSKYSELWIPDTEDHLLAGDLSKSDSATLTYLGALSRMKPWECDKVDKTGEILVVISGPEPSRTRFEELIALYTFKYPQWNYRVVRGTTKKLNSTFSEGTEVFDLVDTRTMELFMEEASLVIGRSGYSSIMDLHVLQKPALLVPTPGQSEQEYLARYLKDDRLFTFCRESKLMHLDPAILLSE